MVLPGLLPRRRAFRRVPSSLASSCSASLAARCGHLLFSAARPLGECGFRRRPGCLRDRIAAFTSRAVDTGEISALQAAWRGPCSTRSTGTCRAARRGGKGGSAPGHLSWGIWMEHCCECSWRGMDGWMDAWMEGSPLLRLSPKPLEERSGIGPRLGGRAGSSGRASASFSCSWP